MRRISKPPALTEYAVQYAAPPSFIIGISADHHSSAADRWVRWELGPHRAHGQRYEGGEAIAITAIPSGRRVACACVRPQGEGEPVRLRQELCHYGFRHPVVSQYAPHRATGMQYVCLVELVDWMVMVVYAVGQKEELAGNGTGGIHLAGQWTFVLGCGKEGVAKSNHSQMEISIEICFYHVQNDHDFTGDVAYGGDRTV